MSEKEYEYGLKSWYKITRDYVISPISTREFGEALMHAVNNEPGIQREEMMTLCRREIIRGPWEEIPKELPKEEIRAVRVEEQKSM